MKNFITITQMMKASKNLKKRGFTFTHLGIGPMSINLLKASLSLAKEKDFPLMLIASRNQVDSYDLGGGYVCGFDQKKFVDTASEIAEEINFDGLCYFCRDHGGPWQRDNERSQKLPLKEAMDRAKKSYLDDIINGFDLLHIDPTKDPFEENTVPLDVVLQRTIELISFAEEQRKKYGKESIAFEVGTEETMGGLISVSAFEGFLKALKSELEKRNLPMPVFIVGQTGTLTRLTENVGRYDTETAANLSKTAARYGTGLKEHNGDYLSNAILLEHPVIDVAAMNVAPEFGVVETMAYRDLDAIEGKFTEKSNLSNVIDIISKYAIEGQRWRKWMVGDKKNADIKDIIKSKEDCALITKMCGHYTLNEDEVKRAVGTLYKNLKKLGIEGEEYIVKKINDSIDRYVYCFNLYGLTSKLKESL